MAGEVCIDQSVHLLLGEPSAADFFFDIAVDVQKVQNFLG